MLLILSALLLLSVVSLAVAVGRGWGPGRLLLDGLGIFAGAAVGAAPGLLLVFSEFQQSLGTEGGPDGAALRLYAALAALGLALGGLGGAAAAEAAFGTRPRLPHVAGLLFGFGLGVAIVWFGGVHLAHARGLAFLVAPFLLVTLGLAGFTLGPARGEAPRTG